MDKILFKVAGSLMGGAVKGDDFIDRMHYFVTSALLLVFAAGIAYQLKAGGPIDCLPPPLLNQEGYQDTMNDHCISQHLYRPDVPSTGNGSSKPHDDGDHSGFIVDFGTTLFKWVAFIFLFQAVTFRVPNMIWRQFSGPVSGDINQIRNLVLQARAKKTEIERRLKMDEIHAYFETWVTGYKTYRFPVIKDNNRNLLAIIFCLGKESGSYVSSLYIAVKCLNLLNVLINFGLIIAFLDTSYWRYGWGATKSMVTTGDWGDPHNFPRMLMCDFQLEDGGGSSVGSGATSSPSGGAQSSPQTEYKVQCMMNINLLLEKAFLLLWFWLVALFVATLGNMLYWFARIKQPISTFLFVKDFIKPVGEAENRDESAGSARETKRNAWLKDLQEDFAEDYLRSDGVFLLRLLELTGDRSVVADIVDCLWKRYKRVQEAKLNVGKPVGKAQKKAQHHQTRAAGAAGANKKGAAPSAGNKKLGVAIKRTLPGLKGLQHKRKAISDTNLNMFDASGEGRPLISPGGVGNLGIMTDGTDGKSAQFPGSLGQMVQSSGMNVVPGGFLNNTGQIGGLLGNTGQVGGFPGNNVPAAGFLGNNGPAAGLLGNNGPAAGLLGNNGPAAGFLGNNGPAAGFLGNNGPAAGLLGNNGPAAGLLGNNEQAAGFLGNNGPAAGLLGNNGPAAGFLGNNGPSAGLLGNNGPAAGFLGNNGPAAGLLGNNGPAAGFLGNNGAAAGLLGNNGPAAGLLGNNGLAAGLLGNNGPAAGLLGNNGAVGGMVGNNIPVGGFLGNNMAATGLSDNNGPVVGVGGNEVVNGNGPAQFHIQDERNPTASDVQGNGIESGMQGSPPGESTAPSSANDNDDMQRMESPAQFNAPKQSGKAGSPDEIELKTLPEGDAAENSFTERL